MPKTPERYDVTYAVNPSDDPVPARLRRKRKNPAELVVIENPAPRKPPAKPKAKSGKGQTRPRAGIASPHHQPAGSPMATKTARKNASTSARGAKKSTPRRNPSMFRNASGIVKDGSGIVVGVGVGELGTAFMSDRLLASQAPLVKGIAAVLIPGIAGVAVVNKTKKGSFSQNVGYGLVATSANNAFQVVKGMVAPAAVGAVGQPFRRLGAGNRTDYRSGGYGGQRRIAAQMMPAAV